MKKYVLIGSAPHMKEYWPEVRDYYIQNDYKIIAINNAWALESEHLYKLYIPNDFLKEGTLIPDFEKINVEYMPISRIEKYFHKNGSTMSINAMYLLLEDDCEVEVVVIGNDYIYNKTNHNHFYGSSKFIPRVQRLLAKNNTEYVGLPADPLRYGDKWLNDELSNVISEYDKHNSKIYVDTPFPEETRLPFKKIVK